MLEQENLKDRLEKGFKDIFDKGIENFIKASYPMQSEIGDEMAKNLSEMFCNIICPQLADVIAANIHTYIKNIEIHGLVVTNGGPTTQLAKINGAPPITAGVIPNTLGVK